MYKVLHFYTRREEGGAFFCLLMHELSVKVKPLGGFDAHFKLFPHFFPTLVQVLKLRDEFWRSFSYHSNEGKKDVGKGHFS